MSSFSTLDKDATLTPIEPEKLKDGGALDPTASESHKLATDNYEEKGVIQLDTLGEKDNEVKDVGWNQDEDADQGTPGELVGGLDNEVLWMLLRRSVFCSRSIYE